jgi:hypothetical protein
MLYRPHLVWEKGGKKKICKFIRVNLAEIIALDVTRSLYPDRFCRNNWVKYLGCNSITLVSLYNHRNKEERRNFQSLKPLKIILGHPCRHLGIVLTLYYSSTLRN